MNSETLARAGEIWDYLSAIRSRAAADAIVLCCSYDLRVCDHACDLLRDGIADTLVISGKHGNWTRQLWDRPEAEVFARRAIENGIDERQILLETRATNFGENIGFSRKLIPQARKVCFVSKPNSLLRVRLTADIQWPEVDAVMSCPDIAFPDEVSNVVGVWGLINEMVGDVDRIRQYPARGFQAAHELPENILHNWQYLIDQGFTYHLLAAGARELPK